MVPELLPFGREQPGVRAGSAAIVHVNLAALHEDRAEISFSANRVILTAGFQGDIPPAYLDKITRAEDGRVLWPMDEAPVAVVLALSTERREAANVAAAAIADGHVELLEAAGLTEAEPTDAAASAEGAGS
eukprot:12954662-Alexandrium_andersonii.AAC.1